jgi:hypothetical protein
MIFVRNCVPQCARDGLRVNGTLTAPFKLSRGERQGDALSAILFTLTIEPFLLICNSFHREYGLSVPFSVTSACAEDITVFNARDGGSKHQGLWCIIRSNSKCAEVNWTSRRPMEKQNAPPVRISVERTRQELSRCPPRQQQNWTLLETKVRAMRTQWRVSRKLLPIRNETNTQQDSGR